MRRTVVHGTYLVENVTFETWKLRMSSCVDWTVHVKDFLCYPSSLPSSSLSSSSSPSMSSLPSPSPPSSSPPSSSLAPLSHHGRHSSCCCLCHHHRNHHHSISAGGWDKTLSMVHAKVSNLSIHQNHRGSLVKSRLPGLLSRVLMKHCLNECFGGAQEGSHCSFRHPS